MGAMRVGVPGRAALTVGVVVAAICIGLGLTGPTRSQAATSSPAAASLGPFFPTAQAGTLAAQPQVSGNGSFVSQLTYIPGTSIAGVPAAAPTSAGSNPDGLAMASTTNSSAPAAGTADWSSYTYSPSHPAFSASNADGTFSAQVPFPTLRLPWGWDFSSLVRNTALSYVSETASLWSWPQNKRLNYSDNHVEPANYTFHSSVPNLQIGPGYQLAINFAWDCYGPSGPGSCILYVRHYFHLQ
jgi:hypothetical protein